MGTYRFGFQSVCLQEEQDFPIWIRYAHKHMHAEGHKLNLLVNLWQMVVRHPDLFYKFRAHFIGQMVQTLSRLRLPFNASTENRKMAIDMAKVIVDWETNRIRTSSRGMGVLASLSLVLVP